MLDVCNNDVDLCSLAEAIGETCPFREISSRTTLSSCLFLFRSFSQAGQPQFGHRDSLLLRAPTIHTLKWLTNICVCDHNKGTCTCIIIESVDYISRDGLYCSDTK